MSAPFHCYCGTVVEATTRFQGAAYTIHFWHPETGENLFRCPGCHEDLRESLRAGRIRDQQGRHTAIDKCSDYGGAA